jgi:hypothetical protein
VNESENIQTEVEATTANLNEEVVRRAYAKHGRKAMVRWEDGWAASKFEFDADDGQGVVWHRSRSCGPGDVVAKSIRLFCEKAYTIVQWRDDV